MSLWLNGGEVLQGIDLDPHPDIIDPRVPRDRAVPASSPKPSLPVRISLQADDSIWVRRDDFAVKVSAKLGARIEDGRIFVEGPVVIRRGYLQLIGRVFELEGSSRLDFVGSDPPDPVLDIRAGTKSRGQTHVGVKISGRASAPVLEFLVDGQVVSAGEAAESLFSGSSSAVAAASQAQSFVNGLMGGLMALTGRRELGELMPILIVDAGDETSSARVRAGFELDSLVPSFLEPVIRGVYVEGIIASGDDEQQQDTGGGVLLELYLPHDLVTSGQYGPGETWSVDLGWEP